VINGLAYDLSGSYEAWSGIRHTFIVVSLEQEITKMKEQPYMHYY
jgi:hypothetical protein